MIRLERFNHAGDRGRQKRRLQLEFGALEGGGETHAMVLESHPHLTLRRGRHQENGAVRDALQDRAHRRVRRIENRDRIGSGLDADGRRVDDFEKIEARAVHDDGEKEKRGDMQPGALFPGPLEDLAPFVLFFG